MLGLGLGLGLLLGIGIRLRIGLGLGLRLGLGLGLRLMCAVMGGGPHLGFIAAWRTSSLAKAFTPSGPFIKSGSLFRFIE